MLLTHLYKYLAVEPFSCKFAIELLVGEIHRQIKLIEQVGSNLRMMCLVIENKISKEGQNNTIEPLTETETVMETVS
jgi:hypothetical protein